MRQVDLTMNWSNQKQVVDIKEINVPTKIRCYSPVLLGSEASPLSVHVNRDSWEGGLYNYV